MYRDHQPTISTWARRSPENLARTIQFVVASAREKFYNVPVVMMEATEGRPGVLFSWKLEAWNHAWDSRESVFHQCEEIVRLYPLRRERGPALIRYLAGLPGLNLAKAGFVAQLAYGCGGCLDTVNLSRLDLPLDIDDNRRYRMKRQTTPAKRLALARWYCETCERLGGVGRLWDDWCAEMSRRYPTQFPTADAASAHHLTCLGLA